MRIKKLFGLFLATIFPDICVSCNSNLDKKLVSFGALCESCKNSIPINTALFCSECKKRNPENKKTCHPKAPLLLASASSYSTKALRELIHSFKYGNARQNIENIKEITSDYLKNIIYLIPNVEYAIVPIPLYPQKERVRGFNQAREIAKVLKTLLNEYGISAEIAEPLVRVKNTKTQTEMKNFKERERNLSGSFKFNIAENTSLKNVILIDDVFTSGATMKEAALTLKSAGAKKILGFVLALA